MPDTTITLAIKDKQTDITVSFSPKDKAQLSVLDADIAQRLSGLGTIDSGILPPTLRWMSPQKRIICFERPPQVVDISYYGVKQYAIKQAQEQVYSLPLPWTIYFIITDTELNPAAIYLFTRPEQLNSLKDPLYLLPLPNLYTNGSFCIPEIQYSKERTTLASAISTAYQLIWNSGFNLDVTHCIDYAYRTRALTELFESFTTKDRISGANLYKRWSQFSVAEVMTWTGWQQAYPKVSTIIDELLNLERDSFGFNYLANKLRNTD